MNLNTGEVDAYITKEIVDDVTDPLMKLVLTDASVRCVKMRPIGETIEIHGEGKHSDVWLLKLPNKLYCSVCVKLNAKLLWSEYEDKIGTVINATVARVEGNIVRIDLGKAQGIMPRSEQIQGERYYPGQRIKVYLKDVERGFPPGPHWSLVAATPNSSNGYFAVKFPRWKAVQLN